MPTKVMIPTHDKIEPKQKTTWLIKVMLPGTIDKISTKTKYNLTNQSHVIYTWQNIDESYIAHD